MPSLTTSPWQAAVDRISSKTVVGSKLRSAEWAQAPLALREQAFFSAGVEDARILSALKEKTVQGMQQVRDGGLLQNKARFVADMRNMLGAAPGDSGELTDLTSRRRLELIWDFQSNSAHAAAARTADLDPDVLDAFPAYRLVRLEDRRIPRDWYALWGVAGAKVGWVGASKTELVALVTSPIWAALSRFGRPSPPFDFGSGMGLDAVDRDETEQLGLLPKNQPPAERQQLLRDGAAQAQQSWNEDLQASVKGISPDARGWLQQAFGDQVQFEGDTAVWKGLKGGKTEGLKPTPAVAPVVLPNLDRVVSAVGKAESTADAHLIISLPANERGTLRLSPSAGAAAQTEKAHEFLRSVVHKDIASTATCKIELYSGRSYYQAQTASVFARKGDIRVTVHEIAHHLECTTPRILQECVAFRDSRMKPGETPQRLSKLTGNRGYRPSEIAVEDEWEKRGGTVYSGKVYPDSMKATEILTVGLERMYLDPVNFARQDPDYFKFILRVLRPTP